MEKFDFENYAKWCDKNHLDGSDSAVLEEYKAELSKVAETSEKAVKIAKQKEVFDTIAKYLGVKTKYCEKHFDGVETALNSICFAMEMCNLLDNTNKSLDKVLDAYCKDKGE